MYEGRCTGSKPYPGFRFVAYLLTLYQLHQHRNLDGNLDQFF